MTNSSNVPSAPNNQYFEIPKSIRIKNDTYAVEEFEDISLVHLLVLIRQGANANLDIKSNAASEIKEVIIPSLSDSVIRINQNGKYLIYLNAVELGDLLRELILIYYKREYNNLLLASNTPGNHLLTDLEKERLGDALNMITSLSKEPDPAENSTENNDAENIENLVTGLPNADTTKEKEDRKKRLQQELKSLETDTSENHSTIAASTVSAASIVPTLPAAPE